MSLAGLLGDFQVLSSQESCLQSHAVDLKDGTLSMLALRSKKTPGAHIERQSIALTSWLCIKSIHPLHCMCRLQKCCDFTGVDMCKVSS
jgi:hypothetical protein